MHNVLIISYIAFPIGKLFILPESFRKVRRFSYSDANGVASSRSPQKTIPGPGRRTG